MTCPECRERPLGPSYKGFPALRCEECAKAWARRKWALPVDSQDGKL